METKTLANAPGIAERAYHIRRNALQHLHQEITITRRNGSFTFEESLARLVKSGAITRTDALERAAHPDEIEALLA